MAFETKFEKERLQREETYHRAREEWEAEKRELKVHTRSSILCLGLRRVDYLIRMYILNTLMLSKAMKLWNTIVYQRALSEADAEIDRQHRELSGSFSVEVHAMEMKCQQKMEQFTEDLAKAEAAANESVQQMLIAAEREKKQSIIAEARETPKILRFKNYQSFLSFKNLLSCCINNRD